jgi:hypothetical protein
MKASAKDDDLNGALVEEVRKLTRPEPIEPPPPEISEEIASLTARVEAVEASTRTLSNALRELRGTARNLNRSARHYTPFRSEAVTESQAARDK